MALAVPCGSQAILPSAIRGIYGKLLSNFAQLLAEEEGGREGEISARPI